MRIQHNIMAMNAYRNYTNNVSAMKKNLEKLSSGYKINRAGDDAAGLAISEKMRAQITGLETAQKNAKDGISLVQTAEGALTEVHDMLNRMVELATQSANGTYDNTTDRYQLQKEMDQLRTEINRIADSANFNGIKLLDGSLGGVSADAAISEITTSKYQAAGASDAFATTYKTNRPAAVTTQQNAVFTVSLDDLAIADKTGGKITLNVGDAKVEFILTKANMTASELAAKLAGAGKALKASDTTKNTLGTSSGANVKIDGNIYEMSATGNTIKFTQVNDMGDSGEVVDTKYEVSASYDQADDTKLGMTGTVNDHVQLTTVGLGRGTSHQAQVDVDIDFSKLKDGDTFIAGNKTYVFKIGDGSGTTAAAGQTMVDLSSILKSSEDLSDPDKLAQAMIKITKDMGNANGAWTVGNEGVTGTVGRLSFQSKSDYVDDASKIGGNANAEDVNMLTEASVMKQFAGASKAQAAKVEFNLDVTKLKAGDTLTINGQTFEFTDGNTVSDKGNIAVDLSSLGIDGGLLASQTGDVMAALKTSIQSVYPATDYAITVDGNKMTLTSVDKTATTGLHEDRIAATVTASGNASGLVLQIGDTADSYNQLRVSIGDCHTKAMGIADIKISDQESAQAAVDAIKSAINYVSDVRGTLGATQNRLDHTINNLSVMTENIQDAESTIRDTDVAAEMMAYTKNNILIQSAQAMLAQANQVPQGVLQLLQ